VKNKLAIIGCATQTRDDVDYNDPDLDIWVFNESCTKDWCKRADGVFQMHMDTIWKNPLNRGDKEHGAWLMSGDTPTVFMLEKYPEVPKSEKYPMQEIVDKYLGGLTVDSERGRKDFFTSTIAYSLALGLYKGYKEIHTYGVELADEDEYRDQQPCAMFWMGLIVGNGIKLVSHSQMFDAPLYPIETFIGLDKQVFQDKVISLEPECKEAQEEYARLKEIANAKFKSFEDVGSGLEEMQKSFYDLAQAGQKFGILDGARQENERIFGRASAMEQMTGTYVFSRHEFNRDQAAIGVEREKIIVAFKNQAVECQRIINRIEPKRFDSHRRRLLKDLQEALDKYIVLSVRIGMYTGAINEDSRFMELLAEAKKNGNN